MATANYGHMRTKCPFNKHQISLHKSIMQGPKNFPDIWKPPSNYRCQKRDIKQASAPIILEWLANITVMPCYLLSTCGQIHLFVTEARKTGSVHNTAAHSWNHCCSGKAIGITYSKCVFVALRIHHAICMHHTVICGLPGTTTIIAWFSIKSSWTQNVCFGFLYNFSPKLVHSRKNSARYDTKCIPIFMQSTRYSCHISMKF